jgi:hypothetical protein
MPTAAGTLETVALEMGKALRPLEGLLGPTIFLRLGVELPPGISGVPNLNAKLTAAAAKAGALDPAITALATAVGGNDTASIIAAGGVLIADIAELIACLTEVGDALHQAANTLPAADKDALQALAANMAIRTLEYLGVGYLDEKMPTLTNSLNLLGIIDREFKPSPTLAISNAPDEFIPRRFHLDRIPKLLVHPDQYLEEIFKWGQNDFDGRPILTKAQALLENLGVPAVIYETPGQPPLLEAYLFSAQADASVSPPGLKLELSLPGNTTFDRTVDFSALWKGTVHVEANYAAGVAATLRPPFTLSATPPTGDFNLDVLLGLKAAKTAADPIIILGAAGGTRLQAKSIGGSLGINTRAGTSGAGISPEVQLEVEEGKLVIDFSKGDGFIQKLLSGVHLEANFPFLATWNPEDGLRLQGSAGVELFIPLHQDFAVVVLNGLYFSLGISADAALQIGLAAQLTTNLGPLVAMVDHIGANAVISFPPGGNGRLGLADINFNFAPPLGVGLSIDTGAIKGGGVLRIDPANGEYFGALELSFQDIISLKAIAIINTKLPDNTPGFALLILVTAEFTPIQLGYGFTLIGVGGLLALNRTLDKEALKVGVRTGAVNSILFPQDIVANVGRIISDLKTIFPILEDHFIIGPMGKLGWGTPTLISLELGIILDIPKPEFTLLGVLRCILPTEEAGVLRLQVNFAGGIDFDRGMIWFDASLFDSRLLIYTLTGDMALRIGWGDEKILLVSVGGFHPAFHEVPSDLRGMRRLSISLLSGGNPRLTAATYFAVTSNTLQSGARVELYAEAGGFNIYGFLGYDLLIQYKPFHLEANLAGGLALRKGNDVLMGISVHAKLSGPEPWHARGEASIKILFFKISIPFDETWGDDAAALPEQTVEVFPLIRAALNDDRNWRASLPANAHLGVTLRKIEMSLDRVILHPFAVLEVNQKVAPLGLEINKFGNQKPVGPTRFELTFTGGPTEEAREEYARANFIQMNDAEKLAQKSFEKLRSGLRFSTGDSSQSGASVQKEVSYEMSYVHKERGVTVPFGLYKLFASVFSMLSQGGAIANHTYAVRRKAGGTPPAPIVVKQPEFMVVNTRDLSVHAPGLVAKSALEAYQLHDQLLANDPSLRGKVQVLSSYELN